MLYNIYAGLGGGFGDADYKGTCDCNTYNNAMQIAYELAVEEYENYAGMRGLKSYEDVAMDYLIEENIIDNEDEFDTYELSETDEEYITELYNDIVESWLDYFVIETNEDINTERLKEDNEYQLI